MNQEIAAIRAMLAQNDGQMDIPQLRAWFDGMADQFGKAADVTIEATLTMRPALRGIMTRPTAWAIRKAPFTFVSMTKS